MTTELLKDTFDGVNNFLAFSDNNNTGHFYVHGDLTKKVFIKVIQEAKDNGLSNKYIINAQAELYASLNTTFLKIDSFYINTTTEGRSLIIIRDSEELDITKDVIHSSQIPRGMSILDGNFCLPEGFKDYPFTSLNNPKQYFQFWHGENRANPIKLSMMEQLAMLVKLEKDNTFLKLDEPVDLRKPITLNTWTQPMQKVNKPKPYYSKHLKHFNSK